MRVTGSCRSSFNSKLAEQAGRQFIEDVALEWGVMAAELAARNVQPGVGPGPHPHVTEHEDTGDLMHSIRTDVDVTSAGVTAYIYTDLDYGLYLEAGWHAASGKFYRYPWLMPAIQEAQRTFRGLAKMRADAMFKGGPHGGRVYIKRGANPWQQPGFRRSTPAGPATG